LDPEDHYQFRVVGANMAGFGIPSEACPAIRLRPESTQFGTEGRKEKNFILLRPLCKTPIGTCKTYKYLIMEFVN